MFNDRRTPSDHLDSSRFYVLVDPGLREMREYYNSLGFDFFANVGDIFFAFRHLPPEAVVETICFQISSKRCVFRTALPRASCLLNRGRYVR